MTHSGHPLCLNGCLLSSPVVVDKFAGEGRRQIGRAVDAYSSWRSASPIEPVAPEFDGITNDSSNDQQVIELLKEHDPLCSGTPAFAPAGLAIDPDAIVLAQVIIAASIQTQASNDHDNSASRMERAILTRTSHIHEMIGLSNFNYDKVLAELTADWTEQQRLLLLIESASRNPFSPYDIAWYPDHERSALAHLATVVGLPASTAQKVTSTFTEAASAHKKLSMKRAGAIGIGAAVALGSAGFLAAPAIGAAVGSAAGLSGAAATSYGLGLLGSLGGASVPGTFTAGGMWLIAQTGVAAGAIAGAGGSMLYSLGAAQAQNEVIKLQVTYKLILFDLQKNEAVALDVFTELRRRIFDLETALEDHQELSDPDSPKIQNLQQTLDSVIAAEQWIEDLHEDNGSVYFRVSELGQKLTQLEDAVRNRRGASSSTSDDLLERIPPKSRGLIEDRMRCRFAVASELDRWDVIAAIGAGIAGAAVDALVIGDPSNALTTRLRSDVAVRDGNWLESLAKVPFDQSIGDGFTPATHRALTPGHDPLIGLVAGTWDILNSTMTRSDVYGAVQFVDQPNFEGSTDVFSALATQIAHLMSDVVTPAGLPLPGWSALTTNRFLAKPAVQMYAKGYDTWNLAPMTVRIAAVHIVGASYWTMRDEEHDPASEARRDSFTMLALGIASIGDLASMLAVGGNPLALNYPMWLELARQTAKKIKRQSYRSASTTIDDATRNQQILNQGWRQVSS